ncbi:MAG: ribonuclease III [Thermoanaerobaculia bacterium]|nr:ribonuclease III [Thermoanaerobaculia bacterium]
MTNIVPLGAELLHEGTSGEERPTRDQIRGLEQQLGHAFRDASLPVRALTHSSWANEQDRDDNYERLEFLGDAVLGLVTSQWLFLRYPDRSEGRLAKLKSYLVSAPVLADYARAVELGPMLRLGVGEERSGGRDKRSILADAVEALFGAVYLDGGFDAARSLIEHVLERGLEARGRIAPADSKTHLQELLQGEGRGLPTYRLVETSGPDHSKTFRVECILDGEVLGSAAGRSKKSAEQQAAAQALLRLETETE